MDKQQLLDMIKNALQQITNAGISQAVGDFGFVAVLFTVSDGEDGSKTYSAQSSDGSLNVAATTFDDCASQVTDWFWALVGGQ